MARIIISDDDRVSLLVLKSIVDFLGHEAITCTNGEEAVAEFRKTPADLVLLDVNMPVMNGMEACRRIRQSPGGGSVPIIIVSGLDDEEDVVEGLDAGANDYLLKPVKDSHLLAKLKIFLRMSSLHNSDFELAKRHAVFGGRFKIAKLLGYGAHSVVFLANDTGRENQKTALKLFKHGADISEIYDAFAETAGKIKNIQCPYLIRTIDYGRSDERLFVAMEYAEKGDMSKMLKTKTFSQAEALRLGIHISTAISEISAMGVVHFDIKPQNIMIGQKNEFILSDFGIASPRSNVTISIKKEVWGTAAYMPPEYLSGEEIFPGSSDIYSLGVTIYEALSGSNPFFSERIVNSMISQINLVPPELAEIDGRFNPDLSLAIAEMMSKDPSARPTPAAVIGRFREILGQIERNPEDEFRLYVHKEAATQDGDMDPECNEDVQSPASSEEPMKFRPMGGRAKINPETKMASPVRPSHKSIRSLDLLSALPHVNLSIPSPSRDSLKLLLRAAFLALALGITSFAALKLRPWAGKTDAADNTYASLSVVKCGKCGFTIEKRVTDISTEKCPNCSSRMGTAFECARCGNIFPVLEADIGISRTDGTSPYTCPKCKSEETEALLTSEEYLRSRSIVKFIQKD